MTARRFLDLLLGTLAAGCVALAVARTAHNVSFHTPLQLVTSGAEEEALFSIWSCAHGQPVYTDPRAIPYTASYFNWLFYAMNGSVSAEVERFFHLDDAWLPTLCRGVTLLFAAGGAAAFFAALRSTGQVVRRRTALMLAIIAFFNPLSGLWLITARPDLGAISLEVAGVACFFRYLPRRRLGWIVLTAFFLYAAWSFKQTALSALAAVALTLLLHRDRRGLSLLLGLWSAGVLCALAALGPNYRHGLYLSQVHAGVDLSLGCGHFVTAAAKMPFILLALVFIPWSWARWRTSEPPAAPELTTTLLVVIAFGVSAVTSCKGGAADYYFIPLAVWSVLWLGVARGRVPDVWRTYSLAAAGGLMVFGIAGVFLGWRGTLDCRDPRQPFEHLARYLANRPGPVFVQSAYGDLPWISPTAPHFVVAFLYKDDRAAGVPFEQGGWENLVARGYFSTVVTDADRTVDTPFSPALLARYRLVRTDAGFDYFERK